MNSVFNLLLAAALALASFVGTPALAEEKPELPVIEKLVRDADGGWVDLAEVSVGEDIEFRLDVSLPSALHGADEYPMDIVDVPSPFLSADLSTVEVSCDGGEMPVDFSVMPDGSGGFRVSFDAAPLAGHEHVFVTYKARLAGRFPTGMGNQIPNKAKVDYTVDGRKESSPFSEADVVTLSLLIRKVDASTKALLPKASFALQEKDSGLILSRGGTWVEAYDAKTCTFETDSEGLIAFDGLASGTYRVVETSAPNGYSLPERGMEVVIDSDLEAGTVSADLSSDYAAVTSVSAESGEVTVTVENARKGDSTPDGGSSTPSKGETPFEKVSYGKVPKLGDDTFLQGSLLLLVACGAVLLFLGWRGRKDPANRPW